MVISDLTYGDVKLNVWHYESNKVDFIYKSDQLRY